MTCFPGAGGWAGKVERPNQYLTRLFVVQVYASTSGDEYSRDNGYPGSKSGAVYPGSFYMQGSVARIGTPQECVGAILFFYIYI